MSTKNAGTCQISASPLGDEKGRGNGRCDVRLSTLRAPPKLQGMRNTTCALILSLVVACGSEDANPGSPAAGGTGGTTPATGGSSGSGGIGAGGSGGGGQGVTRGAVSVHVLSPEGCSLAEHFQDFPELASGRPVTADAKVQALEHGTNIDGAPAMVGCEWITAPQAAGVYRINTSIVVDPTVENRSARVSGVMAAGETRSGSLVLNGGDLSDQYNGSCMITVLEMNEMSRSIWGSFTCDTLTSFDDSDTCAVGPSYFFFENCELAN